MHIHLHDHTFLLRHATHDDILNLLGYLNSLSPESRKRFEPHPFETDSLYQLIENPEYILLLAIDEHTLFIEAYTILKSGWLDFEADRFKSYGLKPQPGDYTFAPSVADYWQGKGLGRLLFEYTLLQLPEANPQKRIFLWGGVQASNSHAIHFYTKLGFKELGQFEYNGTNIDMMLCL
ncbi:MAG: GNAT family N-acetyltransferase [Bacteroidota bacterium]|nr:MAG: GNAT family N-acetyltransferase [Bacteroidota bacterium]